MVEQRQLVTYALWRVPDRSSGPGTDTGWSPGGDLGGNSARRPGSATGYAGGTVDVEPSSGSGLAVLVILGICVVAIVIWIRRGRAPNQLAAPLGPRGSPRLGHLAPTQVSVTVGAMTQWSCGHQTTLSHPLPPGVSAATAPCPACGRRGIVGQYVGGQFKPAV
jgi:hypothetical protein